MKYGEKFEKNFRKGAQILAFSKRNFFFDHPLLCEYLNLQKRSFYKITTGVYKGAPNLRLSVGTS